MSKHKIIWLFAGSVLFLLLLAFSLWCYHSARECATTLTVTNYEVETPFSEPIRLVQLTDLHNRVYGKDNEELIALVQAQEPDLIVMTGDMLNADDDNTAIACDLISDLKDTAPIYFGHGNHEYSWMERTGVDLNPIFTEAGATVLDCEFMDIEVKGETLRIGGYHGYYRQPGMYPVSQARREFELDFADRFEQGDIYKILLCHIPTAWLDWGYIDKYPVDLVLCGHYHGGQIILPLLGPLYAPYVGLFPEYTEGKFEGEQATCILSTGCGSQPNRPRINNLPEIDVIDLIPMT